MPSLVSAKRSLISTCPRRRRCALAHRVKVFFCTATQSPLVFSSTWVWRCRSPHGVVAEVVAGDEDEEIEDVTEEAMEDEGEAVEEREDEGDAADMGAL